MRPPDRPRRGAAAGQHQRAHPARRLDFTVIGAAVNEASRVEALCKELGCDILVTADFAAACPGAPLRSLGRHPLRGVAEPAELFTLD